MAMHRLDISSHNVDLVILENFGFNIGSVIILHAQLLSILFLELSLDEDIRLRLPGEVPLSNAILSSLRPSDAYMRR